MKFKVGKLLDISRSNAGLELACWADVVTVVCGSCGLILVVIASHFLVSRNWVRAGDHDALVMVVRVDGRATFVNDMVTFGSGMFN